MKELHYRTAVSEISQSPYYRNIVDKIASLAPLVPVYDFKGESNIEEIKFRLAQRAMHDLIMQVLRGE